MSSASPGLQSSSQRLGVMPFVLFWNFSGSSSLKSLKLLEKKKKKKSTNVKEDNLDLGTKWWNGLTRAYTWVFMMLECISATPLTAWDPTMHRCAMFTLLHPSSSIRDIFLSLSMSSGKATAILCRGRFRLTCQRRVRSIKKKSVFLWRLKQVYVHRGGPGWSGRWSAGVWAGGSPAAPRASAPEPRGGLCGWCRRKCA